MQHGHPARKFTPGISHNLKHSDPKKLKDAMQKMRQAGVKVDNSQP
jgi:hypothetical protein